MQTRRNGNAPQRPPRAVEHPERVARDERQAAVTGKRCNVDRRPTGDSHNLELTTADAVGDADGCSENSGNRENKRGSATPPALPLARFFDQGIGIRLR